MGFLTLTGFQCWDFLRVRYSQKQKKNMYTCIAKVNPGTVECRYNTVQYHNIGHIIVMIVIEYKWKFEPTKARHNRWAMGCLFGWFWRKLNCVIMALHSIWSTDVFSNVSSVLSVSEHDNTCCTKFMVILSKSSAISSYFLCFIVSTQIRELGWVRQLGEMWCSKRSCLIHYTNAYWVKANKCIWRAL